jgi:Hint domain
MPARGAGLIIVAKKCRNFDATLSKYRRNSGVFWGHRQSGNADTTSGKEPNMFMHNAKSFLNAEKIAIAAAAAGLSHDAAMAGIMAGALVETEAGWRPVEMITAGTAVSTWDGGFRNVRRVERRHFWAGAREVLIPGGALANCSDICLLPGQQVLIESNIAEAVLGQSAVLVQAAALDGFRGIRMRPIDRPVETVSLVFDAEEMVYLNSGCVIRSAGLSDTVGGAMQPGFFPVLDGVQAAALVGLLSDGALSSDDLGRNRVAA